MKKFVSSPSSPTVSRLLFSDSEGSNSEGILSQSSFRGKDWDVTKLKEITEKYEQIILIVNVEDKEKRKKLKSENKKKYNASPFAYLYKKLKEYDSSLTKKQALNYLLFIEWYVFVDKKKKFCGFSGICRNDKDAPEVFRMDFENKSDVKSIKKILEDLVEIYKEEVEGQTLSFRQEVLFFKSVLKEM